MADGAHQFRLLEELFSWYTDAVCTGAIEPVDPEPAPVPLEACWKNGAYKNSVDQDSSVLPAMFAYDRPAAATVTTRVNPACPSLFPWPVPR